MPSYKTPRAFFAYPSEPPSVGEVIRTAAKEINRGGRVVVKGWEECKVGGKIVIQEICREIELADIFCADLTGMNANVMFELGFAIAKNRRIWLVLDTTFLDSKTHFDQLRVLTTVGYSRYCNSKDLMGGFYKDEPYSDLENTVFEKAIRPSLGPTVTDKVLYLKCRHETEASIRISHSVDQLRAADISVIVDDPKESTVQSLTWYGVQVYSSTALICHLTGPDRTGARLLNARYALVCGMAFGMDKKLLMLAEGEFLAPIDYRDLLHHYKTAAEASRHLDGWLRELEKSRYERKVSHQSYSSTVRLATELRGLQVGEYIAENEEDGLVEEYFVETAPFREGLTGTHAVFVGRKGSGKTANFLKLASELTKDRRNLVCVIKPVAYDLHGIVALLRKYKERDAKGYAVESLWKFLLYTEMANAAAKAFEKMLPSALKPDENELLRFLNQEGRALSGDFTVRLERCVEAMLGTHANEESAETLRMGISEALHQGVLKQLRVLLGKALTNKARVAILVDNLDKAWDKQSDLDSLTEFLLGLLSAASRLPVEFRHEDAYRLPVTLSLAIFLRSDIFYKLLSAAREPDKIVHSKINWQDKELLIRIIEERFVSSHEGDVQPAELWARYFCPSVNGVPTREYLCSRILPRPRDLVFFVKAAVATAVNRGQPMVREVDILEAEKQYSQYALESILVENGISIPTLESVLYEFAGCHACLKEGEVAELLKKALIPTGDQSRVIEHLCSLAFLGLEVRSNDFRFAEDPPEYKRNIALARQTLSTGASLGFKIHPAFWAFLEVSAD
jgi:hypothetical protein